MYLPPFLFSSDSTKANQRMLSVLRLLLITALLVACGAHCAPFSVGLRKHANTVVASQSPIGLDRKSRGRAIPMNGSVFTLGAYFADISIGSGPGRITFSAIVDTGSSNLAIPSVGCATCQAEAYYDSSASPTAVPLGCSTPMCRNCVPVPVGQQGVPKDGDGLVHCRYGRSQCVANETCQYSISYGGSSSATAGTIVEDVVCFGEACTMAYVDEIRNELPAGTQTTGIIGLAFPQNACNPTCQPTLMDSMVANGALRPEENLFGLCLHKNNGGLIDFGALNSSRYLGSLLYTPIISQQWYNIRVKDILIGGMSIKVPSFMYAIRNDAIGSFVDSGTGTVLVAPYTFSQIQNVFLTQFKDLNGVQELFGTSTCFTFENTSSINEYPTVGFVVEGATGNDFVVEMHGADYIMPVSTPPPTSTRHTSTSYCLGIAGVPSIGVILGDIIMSRYYIAFDRVNSRLGFAPIKECS